MKYITNSKIVAEEFDSEIILIDIEKGLYFTLGGFAVDLWKFFTTSSLVDDLLDSLPDEGLGFEVALIPSIIEQLITNNLLVEAEGSDESSTKLRAILFAGTSAPTLHVYSDLAELIAIDPVHEVDASLGWPARQDNFPEVS
jgi:hypothetical protein